VLSPWLAVDSFAIYLCQGSSACVQLSILLEIANLTMHIWLVGRETQLSIALTVTVSVLFVFVHPAVIGLPAPASSTLSTLAPMLMAVMGLVLALAPQLRVLGHSRCESPHPLDSSARRCFICSLLC
jgi:hypothetical protein